MDATFKKDPEKTFKVGDSVSGEISFIDLKKDDGGLGKSGGYRGDTMRFQFHNIISWTCGGVPFHAPINKIFKFRVARILGVRINRITKQKMQHEAVSENDQHLDALES